MKFIKQDLLTLLIGLFLFSSCNKSNEVGLDVDPSYALKGTLVDNEEVQSKTVREKAINTLGLSNLPLGYMEDPVFGVTEAKLALGVNVPVDAYDFHASAQIDSAILVLPFAPGFYGDTVNTTYKFKVQQLAAKVTEGLSTTDHASNAPEFGSFSAKIRPNTPIKVMNVVNGAKDTAANLVPQIRIKLDNALIQSTIVQAGTHNLSNNGRFVNYFKGLKVYAEGMSGANGGLALIDLNNSKAYVQIVYRSEKTTGTKDTLSVNFPIAASANNSAAYIKHNYAGTNVEKQLNNQASSPANVTYIQGLGGVRTQLNFPSLSSFKQRMGKTIVNKAELEVNVVAGTFGNPFTALERIALYRNDLAGQPTRVPDNQMPQSGYDPLADPRAVPENVFGGYYDALKNKYVFIVTAYVQDMIDAKITDNSAFLAASPTAQFSILPSAGVASRVIIGDKTHPEQKIKLNIYYTKLEY